MSLYGCNYSEVLKYLRIKFSRQRKIFKKVLLKSVNVLISIYLSSRVAEMLNTITVNERDAPVSILAQCHSEQ